MLRLRVREITTRRSRLATAKPVPERICLRITSRCNQRCVFCELGRSSDSAAVAQARTDLPVRTIRRLIDFAATRRLPVFFSGGEPFLHPQIWAVLDYCRSVGIRVSLVTNGSCLASLDDSRRRLLNETVAMMSLSIDEATAEEHDRLRGVPRSFSRACSYLDDPRRRHAVALNAVLLPDFSNARPMVEFARLHRTSVNFQVLNFDSNFPGLEPTAWKRAALGTLRTDARRTSRLYEAYEYARRNQVITNLRMVLFFVDEYYRACNDGAVPFFDRLMPGFVCFVPLSAVIVDERGHVLTCLLVPGAHSIEEEDWLEKWQAHAVAFREAWRRGTRFPACRFCTCHFAENLRSNVAARPLSNIKQIPWLTSYYARRLVHGEGRVQR